MSETKDVQIERVFDVPIDLIWSMWTEPEHFARWYGPRGAEIPRADMDVRVGGRRHVVMRMDTPDGPMTMFFVGEYREVDPKTRLVYTESMADADGNVMTAEQAGMPAGAPTETSIVVELTDLMVRPLVDPLEAAASDAPATEVALPGSGTARALYPQGV